MCVEVSYQKNVKAALFVLTDISKKHNVNYNSLNSEQADLAFS